jgi:hypothetical protein
VERPRLYSARILSSNPLAAGDGPFVVLLGEQRADQADDRGPVGEDADDVGAAANLAVQALE